MSTLKLLPSPYIPLSYSQVKSLHEMLLSGDTPTILMALDVFETIDYSKEACRYYIRCLFASSVGSNINYFNAKWEVVVKMQLVKDKVGIPYIHMYASARGIQGLYNQMRDGIQVKYTTRSFNIAKIKTIDEHTRTDSEDC